MRIHRLTLANFRNYDRLDLDLPPGVSVFWGDNAQGKSNLLEAVYYLAMMRSFRAGSDRDLLAWSEVDDPLRFTRIAARLVRAGDGFSLDIVLRQESNAEAPNGGALTKRIKVNDVPRRAIDTVGTTLAVLFSPRDLDLVDGSPSVRRRYLDITLSQEDPRYCRGLAHYNRVILQRNHLLRSIRDRGTKPDEIRFWDDEMIEAGAYLVARRHETVVELARASQGYYAELGQTDEILGIGYKNNVLEGHESGPVTLDEIRSAFAARLEALATREVTLGASLVGPHRDDLTFHLDDHAVAEFGSRGQQRTVALALKLAEMEHLSQGTGELPILLLDDVFSELDPHRRQRVLDTIKPEQQVLITSTEPTALKGYNGVSTSFEIVGGRVVRRLASDVGGAVAGTI